MKKIMFSDKFCLTQAVLSGTKTMTRRLLKDNVPLGNWEDTKKHLPYKVGEIIAIAQSYHTLNKSGYVAPKWCEHTCESSAGYENKMFVKASLMPHHIRITDVKVERLQDISDEDALREGIRSFEGHEIAMRHGLKEHYTILNTFYIFDTPCEAYAKLIDMVSGKGTWESNPYVIVYIFELVD